MEFAEAGDGAVDSTAGAVGEGAFEKLFFEGVGEGAGGGGLEDAVADSGDEEGAGFEGFGFLDNDLEEGAGLVAVVAGLCEKVVEVVVDGDGVGAGAAGVFADSIPGGEEVVTGEGGGQG